MRTMRRSTAVVASGVLAAVAACGSGHAGFRVMATVPAATVDAMPESCDSSAEGSGTIPAGYRRMPASIVNCTDHPPENMLDVSYWDLDGDGPTTCWRLQRRFRTAALRLAVFAPLLRDGTRRAEIMRAVVEHMEDAAVLYYWNLGDNFPQAPINGLTPAHADAMADLAVTGRTAFQLFGATRPREETPEGGAAEDGREVRIDRVRAKILEQAPTHVADDREIADAITRALDRSYTVLWAIRGPTSERARLRSSLGYIAVSGEDDPPHRPVNVMSPDLSPAPAPLDGAPSLPALTVYQQDVPVGVPMDRRDWSAGDRPVTTSMLQVQIRYLIIVDSADGLTTTHPATFEHRTLPPGDDLVNLPPGHDVILFIPGHSSRAEEAMDLARPLIAEWRAAGRRLAVISLDLPSNGYSTMLDHRAVADVMRDRTTRLSDFRWHDGSFVAYYPILDFIEETIVRFVEQIGRYPYTSLRSQIKGVVGGSLGGNLGLRLSRRSKDPTSGQPYLHHIIAFSPASTWGDSWARARPCGPDLISCAALFEAGTYSDTAKWAAVNGTRNRYLEYTEPDDRKLAYFVASFTSSGNLVEAATSGTFPPQGERWYRSDWPCRRTYLKHAILDRWEIYSTSYRTWHWRVAHEQLLFMHNEPSIAITSARGATGGARSYERFTSHLLLLSGAEDNAIPEKLYDNTRALAEKAEDYHRDRPAPRLTGRTMWLEHTGHSIQSERPRFFARQIVSFLSHAFRAD